MIDTFLETGPHRNFTVVSTRIYFDLNKFGTSVSQYFTAKFSSSFNFMPGIFIFVHTYGNKTTLVFVVIFHNVLDINNLLLPLI